MVKKLFLIPISFLVFIVNFETQAQDPQFSQFYAAPLYLNPALTGSSSMARAGLNYRMQWPSIEAKFITTAAYFDYFFEDYNSGIGVLISNDYEGIAGLRSTSVSVSYAYQLSLTKWLTFRPGVQGAYVNRSLNFSKLTFGDQFNETGQVKDFTDEDLSGAGNLNYFDLGLGGFFYSKSLWLGYSASHLTRPSQAFVEGNNRVSLPIKHSIHIGYKWHLPSSNPLVDRERSLSPTAQLKFQNQFKQLEVGLYTTLEPIIFGLWYRGLPFGAAGGTVNHESAVLLVGFLLPNFNVGYSFDFTLSQLGIRSGGAHEISLSYNFNMGNKKPPKNVRRLPCPKF